MKRRLYKSGSRWALWRWTITDSEYIIRLHLIKTPWFAICLHWILKPDPEPYYHDHPVSFLSLFLRGGYYEQRTKVLAKEPGYQSLSFEDGWRNWWNFIRASDRDVHKITEVKPKTLTLCLMGPKTREWGFVTPKGWLYWKTYNELKRKGIQP